MSPQTIYYTLAAVQVASMIIMTVLMWRMRGEFASRREFDDLKSRVGRQHDRVVKLETRFEALPSEKGLHDLAQTLERFRGDLNVAIERIAGVKGNMERLESTVDRHEDILAEAARSGR